MPYLMKFFFYIMELKSLLLCPQGYAHVPILPLNLFKTINLGSVLILSLLKKLKSTEIHMEHINTLRGIMQW